MRNRRESGIFTRFGGRAGVSFRITNNYTEVKIEWRIPEKMDLSFWHWLAAAVVAVFSIIGIKICLYF